MFDTHAVARTLTEAELTPAQADAITDAVRLAAEHDAAAIDVETLATKSDVAGVEAALKSDIAGVEAALKSDIAEVKSDVASVKSDVAALEAVLKSDVAGVQANVTTVEAALKSDVAGVKSDVAALEARLNARTSAQETRLIKWMVGVGVGVAGLVVAALRLLGQGAAP